MRFWPKRKSVVERALADTHLYGPLHYIWDHNVVPRLPKWKKTQPQAEYRRKHETAVARLTHGQRLVLNLYVFTAEVNNGGLVQYFWNSSGDATEELLENLSDLGAKELRNAIADARSEIFDGPVPQDTRFRRQRMVEFHGTHPFNDDDDYERLERMRESPLAAVAGNVFFEREEQLLQAVREYISGYPDEFPR